MLPQPKVEGQGVFYSIDCDIILLFGMTELKAQVAWQENVSSLHHMSLNLTDFGLRVVFREERNGKILKETVS